MEIEELETKNKTQYILEQILEKIKQGELQVGDKLPSESELAEMANVSRTSVREALAALRLTGVVESKGSQGTILKKSASEFRLESVSSLLQKETSPAEVLVARKVLSRGVVSLVLQRVDHKDIDSFQQILDQMEEAVHNGSVDRYLSLNKEFHLNLFRVTEIGLIIDMAETLLSHMEEGLGEVERHYYYESKNESLQESLTIHRNIVNSLKSGDEGKLEEALSMHFDRLGGESSS